ncbi:EndoU domain-containing protein [Wolbachia endosymbiont of Aedes albopictus]
MSRKSKIVLCLMIPIIGLTSYVNGHYFTDSHIQKSVEDDFEPFFRTNPSQPKYIPDPPKLTEFDRDVLKICGDWGSYPSEKDFRSLLDSPEYQGVVKGIYDKLDHQVITPNADLGLFKDELTQIWFAGKGSKFARRGENGETVGFRHVFCDEPDKSKLGGMHFVGRYLEAQGNKWAGAIWYDAPCNKTDIEPPVYTLGVKYLGRGGNIKVNCEKGYAYNLHADDILVYATKAFKELRKDGGCLYEMEGGRYQSVFVRERNAIITFYPDLTPHCDDKRTYCSCSNS